MTYSRIVSRDSVRIIFLLAALNDLDLKSADIKNAFLTAPNKEKVWIRASPEFGASEGCIFIVRKALYGLKSAGASFRSYLAKRLDEIGFKSSHADPDVWLRPSTKPDGEQFYEYMMCYVDNVIAVSMDATKTLREVQHATFRYKNDVIEEPRNYLGAKIMKKKMNGHHCWTISSQAYVEAAIETFKTSLKSKPWKLPPPLKTPMSSSYIPELDKTAELEAKEITFYQELIGILRWATELGCVDILHEISILSQYQASPRRGHLLQLLQIFSFLDKNPKLVLYLDPGLPRIDYATFRTNPEDFHEMYRDDTEEMPHRMPPPRGRPVWITAFVDASHGANKVTRKSHSGYIVFINQAPILWYSKRQQTVESSAFSSEFIALKVCVEALEGLRFKLRMFGVPLPRGEPSHCFCDNESVVKNTTNVESTLNKKHSQIAYHFVRWCVAAGVVTLSWID